MKAKTKEKQLAIELRRAGKSLEEIAVEIKVSKSSVSSWVCGVKLSDEQVVRLKQKISKNAQNGTNAVKKMAEERHLQFKKQGFEKAKRDADFRVICALYWGEGRKVGNDVSLANADSGMIRFFLNWVIKNNLRYSFRLQYYKENGLTDSEICDWWLRQIPELDKGCFCKHTICKINRASQMKKIGKLPYGTATIRVVKSTNLFFEIMGGIESFMGA